jgi:hypothetical protein
MSGIVEIEQALQQLSAEELALFRQWYAEFDERQWDQQLEADVAAGRLDDLAEEALRDLREGRSREL